MERTVPETGVSTAWRRVTRLGIALFAAAAVIWTVMVFPRVESEKGLTEVASHILAGESYKPDQMAAWEQSFDAKEGALRPSTLSKLVLFRLRRVDNALTVPDRKDTDPGFDPLQRTLDAALANTPSEPFLWLTRYWLEDVRDKKQDLGALKLSYSLGPREGWIAIKRNRLALAGYAALDSDLADWVITEFVGLVQSRLYEDAADILAGPGWPLRHQLVARLQGLKDGGRFAKMLSERGFDDNLLPSMEASPSRPWQR